MDHYDWTRQVDRQITWLFGLWLALFLGYGVMAYALYLLAGAVSDNNETIFKLLLWAVEERVY